MTKMLKVLFLIPLLLLVEAAIATTCKDAKGKFSISKGGGKWARKNCSFVGNNKSRCNNEIKNSDKLGKDMCPYTCNNCPPTATATPTVKPTEAAVPVATNVATKEQREPVETCFDYTKVMDLGQSDCSYFRLFETIRGVYNEQRDKSTTGCAGGLVGELRKLTGTIGTTGDEYKEALQDLCDEAFNDDVDEAETITWKLVEDANIDLEEFYNGGGFMNNDYGNLQQKTSEFEERGGYTKYAYIGEDPTLNDYLPTSKRSVEGGRAILNLYEEITKKVLSPPSYSKLQQDTSCSLTNAVVCCWSRDRQYNDNNGDCDSHGKCRDGNPADNTDLCWTKDHENDAVFPYPTQQTEGPLHCHGYSWSDGDFTDALKHNNLFYVSMYDHLYQRGYVQSITDDYNIYGGNDAMCGCVEEMASVVARADCTEIVPKVHYIVYQNENDGYLEVKHVPDELEFEYQACEGFEYNSDVSPEMYSENPKSNELGLKRKNNDLSALVYRQYLEGKKSLKEIEAFEETIIGFKDPEVNDSDNAREIACKAAFDARYPDQEWMVVLPAQE